MSEIDSGLEQQDTSSYFIKSLQNELYNNCESL